MVSSLSTLLPTKANFTIWLCALSLAITANLSHAAASGDKESTLEALKFAAEVLLSWEERALHLSDVEWAGADDILAAAQALWEEWSGANWSMTAPLSHFFVDDLESPMPKVAKWAKGHVFVNQNPSFQKTMADMAGSHAT
ncbi:hypothetical protein C0991_010105, partial [Blastosporella zonata]